jgi:hypothetical protein
MIDMQGKGLLAVLDNSEFTFYLTGSRFFGGARADSDWDFMAETSKELKDFLCDNRFLYESCNYSRDRWTTAVFANSNNGTAVHVQLCTDVESKLRAQKWILEHDNGLFLPLLRRAQFSHIPWEKAFNAVKGDSNAKHRW